VPVPESFDGESLMPLLRGETPDAWRRDVVCEIHGHHFPYPQRMIRTARHKLVINPPDVNELYDLEIDPHELTNRIDDPAYAAVRRDLMNRLYQQLRARGDNFYHWMTSMFEVDVPAQEDASLSEFRRHPRQSAGCRLGVRQAKAPPAGAGTTPPAGRWRRRPRRRGPP
jgi:arylsulfatase A-like enzyme